MHHTYGYGDTWDMHIWSFWDTVGDPRGGIRTVFRSGLAIPPYAGPAPPLEPLSGACCGMRPGLACPGILDSWILDSWILDSWILDSGYWILDTGFWSLVTGFWSLVTGAWLLGPATEPDCSCNEEPDTSKQLAAVSGGGIAACGSRGEHRLVHIRSTLCRFDDKLALRSKLGPFIPCERRLAIC